MNDTDYVLMTFRIHVGMVVSHMVEVDIHLSPRTKNRIKLTHENSFVVGCNRSCLLKNENFDYIKNHPKLSTIEDGRFIMSMPDYYDLLNDDKSGISHFDDTYKNIIKVGSKNKESYERVMAYINR